MHPLRIVLDVIEQFWRPMARPFGDCGKKYGDVPPPVNVAGSKVPTGRLDWYASI